MSLSTLMAISPLDGRYSQKLAALRTVFSEYGLIRLRVLVEIRWLQFLATEAHLPELPQLSTDAQHILKGIIDNFSEADAERIKEIESSINHDVKAVEYFIKERIENNAELRAVNEFIHFGCTSEDINNLAYGLMLTSARQQIILPHLHSLLSDLKNLAHTYAGQAMLARTHGQPATPSTLGKEIANVVARLERQVEQLEASAILGKMNGATGNYNAHCIAYPDVNWHELCKKFISQLGLTFNAYTTQIEPHDYMAEFFMNVCRINTLLIDFNRDMWSYIAIDYFHQKSFGNEVGSSTMPHKINPIDFENAEGNLGMSNALLNHFAAKLPISRWQRDLSDSTVLRNIGVAIGHAVLAYQSTLKGLQKVSPNLDRLNADLDLHWEVLAEPVQTVMRRFGIPQPYEKLKSFTRGRKIDKGILHEFIRELTLPEAAKAQLLALTPSTYLGIAVDLARKI